MRPRDMEQSLPADNRLRVVRVVCILRISFLAQISAHRVGCALVYVRSMLTSK